MIHRYTGLLQCGDCGGSFTARICRKGFSGRTEYICLAYHRYGKEQCTSHRIHEEDLDKLIEAELLTLKRKAAAEWQSVEQALERWLKQKNGHEKLVAELTGRVAKLENEIEKILMERIEDKENRAVYDSMIAKRREEIAALQGKIAEYADLDAMLRQRKATVKRSAELLNEIIIAGAISDAHLRMLVDKVIVWERANEDSPGSHLELEICFNAAFRIHFDEFDQGELTDRGYLLTEDGERFREMTKLNPAPGRMRCERLWRLVLHKRSFAVVNPLLCPALLGCIDKLYRQNIRSVLCYLTYT